MKNEKILFLDRDGTIIEETDDEKIDNIDKLRFLPNVFSVLRKISEEMDYKFVMVTNQDGMGTPFFPKENFWPIHNFILDTLKGEQINFFEVHVDQHYLQDNHPNRKPGIGMVKHFMNGNYDLKNSFVIGDRVSDLEFAKNLGTRSIFVSNKQNAMADFHSLSWPEIYNFLKNQKNI